MRLKKIITYRLFSNILAAIGYCYIKLVYYTTTWQTIFSAQKQDYNQKVIIYAFWHGRLTLMPCFRLNDNKTNVLISSHNDGKIITSIMKYFNLAVINTKSKNINVIRNILSKLHSGQNIAITPDSAGRRGPRMRVRGNVISIAKKTNAVIIPLSFSVSNNIILKTWDKFLFPLPFSKGVFIYGKPINVLDDMNIKDYNILLEEELNRITAKSDRMLNLQQIVPDENI